jgi:hypothetical protein
MARKPEFSYTAAGDRWKVEIPSRYSPSGKRERAFFPTRDKAKAYAAEMKEKIATHGALASNIRPSLADDATLAVKMLEPYGLSLLEATSSASMPGLSFGKDKPRDPHKGHAPIFEMVTQYPDRAAIAAKLPDLLGRFNPATPWKQRLPRMFFVSDMGDALSSRGDFGFLKTDLMPAINFDAGKLHLWLWLTKRPEYMARFAEEIGGFPSNVCAMTTLTGPDETSLKRLTD